jgi:hypothetical protein
MTQRRFVRQSASDLVRVGVITGPGGHSSGIWGEKMNPTADFIRTTGMIMTHVWSIRPEFAKELEGKFQDVKAVEDPRDMIGQIDGFILDDVTAISHYPLLARPFLEAGIPTMVNRPFATSMAKGREMVELAEKHAAALLTFSTWEFSESIGDLRAKANELPAINGYVAHNSMSDYYTHGLHGVWYIHAALRDEMVKGRGRVTGASYHTRDWRRPGGLITFEHETPDGPHYYGSLMMPSGADAQAYLRIFGGHSGDAEGKIPGRPGFFQYNTWNAAQLALQEMFETGVSPQTGQHLLDKLEMFLLPFYSVLERGGSMVRPQEIADWELPRPSEQLMLNGHPGDSAFKAPYSDAEMETVEQQFGN